MAKEYIPSIISSIVTLVVAVITSWYLRRNEILKIKSEQENLNKRIESDLRNIFLSIESDNYRTLYNKKLKALKKIKTILFVDLETTSAQDDFFDSKLQFLQNFDFKGLKNKFHKLILKYSHIFNTEIVDQMKSIHNDAEYNEFNYEPDSPYYYNSYDRIFEKVKDLSAMVSKDLNIDYKSLENKVSSYSHSGKLG